MCERLSYEGTGLYHKRSIKNVLRFKIAPDPIILLGVGVYNGEEEELLDPNAIITFDRCTTSIKIWLITPSDNPKKEYSTTLLSCKTLTMNTEEGRKLVKTKIQNKVKHTMNVWLDAPVILEKNVGYEIEHNILPTDVQNHFSGYPITTLGADLWTCHGSTKTSLVTSCGTQFTFSDPLGITGRSCLWEGQIPYLRFWKL